MRTDFPRNQIKVDQPRMVGKDGQKSSDSEPLQSQGMAAPPPPPSSPRIRIAMQTTMPKHVDPFEACPVCLSALFADVFVLCMILLFDLTKDISVEIGGYPKKFSN